MFSKQLSSLMNVRSLSDLQQALRNLLGNCAQPLEHRGPVTIDVTRPDNATDAGLTVRNGWTKAGTPDGTNGFAIKVPEGIARFDGPIWPMFRPNWIKFVLQGPLLAVPGDEAQARVVQQQPQSSELVHDLIGETVTITNDVGYWHGTTGDSGEASIWYTDQPADEYEWRPRVIKTTSSTFEAVADDSAAVCTDATCKPYFWTVTIGNLGSGGTCQELNGKTFLLTYTSSCVWKIDGLALGGTCAYDEIRLTVSASGGNTRLTLAIYNTSNVQQASTYTDVTGTPANLCGTVFTNSNSDFDVNWTTVGPPPVITGPPTITLTPYVAAYQSDATCSCCNDSKVPSSYTITLSGVANGGCDGCASWNGTYVVTRDPAFNCYYTVTVHQSAGTSPCDVEPSWLAFINFWPCLGSLCLYGRDALGTQHSCATFTVPANCWQYYNEPQTSKTTYTSACDFTAASYTVSVNY